MPTLAVYADSVCSALKIDFSSPEKAEKEFDALVFEYGLELDEVTSQKEAMEREKGEKFVKDHLKALEEEHGENFSRVQYKLDIPANRYDLLCLEGLVSALLVYKRYKEIPAYKVKTTGNLGLKATLDASAGVVGERPYAVFAALRGIKFTKDSYNSFIDLQDKLHQNIGRRRELVSMGTHDLDTIQSPFVYKLDDVDAIKFVPLKDPKSKADDGKFAYTAREILEGYKSHTQLGKYTHLCDSIIEKTGKTFIIYDKNGDVCSMPPIINSWKSRITIDTKNVLLDVTGADYTKCCIVLDTLCAMFAGCCEEELTIEPVEMTFPSAYPSEIAYVTPGTTSLYPKMEVRSIPCSKTRMCDFLDLHDLSTDEVRQYMERMQMPVTADKDDPDKLTVHVPCTRSDIMHEVDLIEDLAIAYGYDNLKTSVPELATEPRDQPINRLTDMVRVECAGAGFNECLNFALCSKEDCFDWLRRTYSHSELPAVDSTLTPDVYNLSLPPVLLSKPKAKEYNMVRTTLIQGLLKTMNHNKLNPLPIRLFEVSDVCVQDKREETGARNQRRVAGLYAGQTSGFEYVHGLIDHLMLKLNLRSEVQTSSEWKKATYKLVPRADDPTFLEGMVADIVLTGTTANSEFKEGLVIGIAGVLRPDVLDPPAMSLGEGDEKVVVKAPWSLKVPCSVVEFNLQPFLKTLCEE